MHILEISRGKKHAVSIAPLEDADLNKIFKKRYVFDWKKEKDFAIYKLTVIDLQDILGLISLEFFDEESRVHIRLLTASVENIGRQKFFKNIAGCLLCHAAILALEKYGEYAAVSLRPKTELAQHYMDTYGFEQAGINLFVENERLKNLYKKYA